MYIVSNLIQFSGSFTQSVLHLNLSHVSQPIGGVNAKPLSSEATFFVNVNEAKNRK
jgi:hypothetical protein